jgi:hypothetical protein
VTEAEFWQRLEFRISHELTRAENRALRFLWCDGFVPEGFILEDPTPRIVGQAWIGDGSRQDRWEFTLFLDAATRARSQIPWSALLPPDETTGWLTVDVDARRIELSPSQAKAA